MVLRITGGKHRGRLIKSPAKGTRPTQEKVRKALFDRFQFSIADCCFLDLFAGSGAMGIEALSRGAAFSVFVEKNRLATKIIQDNLKSLELLGRSRVLCQDALKALQLLRDPFDFIFFDPPYGKKEEEEQLLEALSKQKVMGKESVVLHESIFHEFHPSLPLEKIESRNYGNTWVHEWKLP